LPGYHDVRDYAEAEVDPGLVLFRFGAPLFFANARAFQEALRKLAAARPRPRWIVVTAEPITDVDTSAADVLGQVSEELAAEGVALVFAEVKDPVRRKLARFGLLDELGTHRFFPTIESAVDAFQDIPRPRRSEREAEQGPPARQP
jgi:MFS superfamily sulfate permease-like transporter